MNGSQHASNIGEQYLIVSLCLFLCLRLPCAGSALAADLTTLRESLAPGSCTQVRIELKAAGLFRPGLPSGAVKDEAMMPKPLALDVKTRLILVERLMGEKARKRASDGDSKQREPRHPPGQPQSRRRFVGSFKRLPRSMARSGRRPVSCGRDSRFLSRSGLTAKAWRWLARPDR